ncbi:MAG: glycosyltransferase family 39 protein [Acidobacteriota bacterium]
MSTAGEPRRGPRGELLAGLALLVFYLPASLSYVLWRHVDHNEHMYAAAAAARSELVPYRDFCWIQGPYWIDLLSTAQRLVGGEHLLLTGRLLNWSLGLVGLLLVHHLLRRAAGPWVALLLTGLLALNRHFLVPLAEGSNYMLGFAAGMAAVVLLLRALDTRRWLAGFVSGVLLGIATGAKLYHAAAWPVFVLVALRWPRELSRRERARGLLLPGAVGLLVGLLPFGLLVLQAPGAALFGNLRYHALNQHVFDVDGITLGDNLRKVLWMAGLPETAAVLLFLLVVVVLGLIGRVPSGARGDVLLTLFALHLPLALAAAVTPRPVHSQYFLFPLPFALLLAGRVLGALPTEKLRRVGLGAGALALVAGLVVTAWPLARGLPRWLGEAPTTPTRMEGLAVELRELVGEREGAVATLSPLHPLEAGLPILPELVTGPFAYRMAGLVSAEERRAWRIVAPEELPVLLARRPPAAVLIGEEGRLDLPLEVFAQAAGYERHELSDGRLVAYLRPETR